MMLYSNHFTVVTDANNQWEAQTKAFRKIKDDPKAFLRGTYLGVGRKKKGFWEMLLRG